MIEGILTAIGITGAVAAVVELALIGLAVKEGYDLALAQAKKSK